MDEGARFPGVAAKAGHYESFYVKACAPGGGRGIWIRHTVHKRPGAEPSASIWFVLFDRAAGGPRATKVTVPAAALAAPAGSWIRIGGVEGELAADGPAGERRAAAGGFGAAEIGPGRARGSVGGAAVPSRREAPPGSAAAAVPSSRRDAAPTNSAAGDAGVAASWELSFAAEAPPCRYLPAEWLYRAPLPRTKFVAPLPLTHFQGRLEVDGEAIEVDGWPGMVGHNWGSEHAERWVWLEGTGFADAADAYFDAGAARVKLGSRTSPWIPAGMLRLDGEEHRLGGLGAIRAARIEESPGACSFLLPGRDVVVRGRVAAPTKDFVGWIYADPKGPEHNTLNCSVADLELTVERPGQPPRELRLAAGAAYELGLREADHGVPIQPFPDG